MWKLFWLQLNIPAEESDEAAADVPWLADETEIREYLFDTSKEDILPIKGPRGLPFLSALWTSTVAALEEKHKTPSVGPWDGCGPVGWL